MAMAGLPWMLCFLALYADAVDVNLNIVTPSAVSVPLMVDGKDTGCTSQSTSQDLTCIDRNSKTWNNWNQVPATYFSAVINCKYMDTSVYDSLTVKPSRQCAKMTFTQHMEGDNVNLETLEMLPNSIANFTCVVFPFQVLLANQNDEGWRELPLTADITGIKKGQDDKVLTWTMGSLKFRNQDSAIVPFSTCRSVVGENFQWGLRLLTSAHNVHQLLWTSQAKKPDVDLLSPEINIYNFQVTKTVKDVAFKDLSPWISQANCSTASGNIKDHVKLRTFKAREQNQAEKHEEKVELSVDATQLPKGTKELEVTVSLLLPSTAWTDIKLKLPVVEPIIPDDNPSKKPREKENFGWLAFPVIAFFMGGCAFLYRRHRRIQATGIPIVFF